MQSGKMNKLIILSLLSIITTSLMAQDRVTLETCYEKAIENYPLSQQEELLTTSNELSIDNLNKNYLPQMAVNGQASYQSDVTKIPVQNIPAFGIEPLSKDWYKITLDVNQIIYDGGTTSKSKDLEQKNLQIDQQQLQVEYHGLKERINQVYFAILLLKSNKEILQLHLDDLKAKIKEVHSGVENGVLLASNENVLKAEIIKIQQSIGEVEADLNASIRIMQQYTGIEMNDQTEFQLPEVEVDPASVVNQRPEMTLFSLQQEKLEASKKLTASKLLPRLSAFGQAGYGRPGFDMLDNQFTDFYIVGARLSWNFWDWNHTKKEKEIFGIKQQIIETQKANLDRNISIDLENKRAAIHKAEENLKSDADIITLRDEIVKSASSQLNNGVITSSEYLTELNAQSKAKLDREVHKIELVKAKIAYKTTLGNL